ncbi:unnamed protein product, partial [Polarella glacialis]
MEESNVPSAKQLERMREAMLAAGKEVEEANKLREAAEEALAKAQSQIQLALDRADAAEGRSSGKDSGRLRDPSKLSSSANLMDGAAEMDEIRMKMELLKIELAREKENTSTAEARAREAEEALADDEQNLDPVVSARRSARSSGSNAAVADDYAHARQALLEASRRAACGISDADTMLLQELACSLGQVLAQRSDRLAELEASAKSLQDELETAKDKPQALADSERANAKLLAESQEATKELEHLRAEFAKLQPRRKTEDKACE